MSKRDLDDHCIFLKEYFYFKLNQHVDKHQAAEAKLEEKTSESLKTHVALHQLVEKYYTGTASMQDNIAKELSHGNSCSHDLWKVRCWGSRKDWGRPSRVSPNPLRLQPPPFPSSSSWPTAPPAPSPGVAARSLLPGPSIPSSSPSGGGGGGSSSSSSSDSLLLIEPPSTTRTEETSCSGASISSSKLRRGRMNYGRYKVASGQALSGKVPNGGFFYTPTSSRCCFVRGSYPPTTINNNNNNNNNNHNRRHFLLVHGPGSSRSRSASASGFESARHAADANGQSSQSAPRAATTVSILQGRAPLPGQAANHWGSAPFISM
ncbi:uncharacterized protein DDB_G0281497-like [Rhincodon typus]|uniref:uncharacterized protein DDB_G0281497-like n=1 Tax=Rhincodon typus TaxID=259920 RepID=UPI00202F894C|nr:uncharacterized protein DDB_G0281497-like [Rhincodon typus]